MTVRVRYKIQATVSSSSAEEKDLCNQMWEVVCDGLGEGGSWKTVLLAGAGVLPDPPVQLYLGNVASAKLVIVRTNSKDPTQAPNEIVLMRNSPTGEATTVIPLVDAKEAHMLLISDGVTALYAINPGTVDMEVTVVAAGD
jgi:hypothetical protein